MSDINQIRQQLLPLAKFNNLRGIKLFGSRARGDNTVNSDYDFAVMAETSGSEEWLDIEEAVRNCVNLPADVVEYNKASAGIKEQIDASGVVVLVNEKWYISLVRLGKAFDSLEDIIHDGDDTKHKQRDAVLTRFKYVFESTWKTLGRLLIIQGFDEKSPRDIIVRANQMGWIDGALWTSMLQKRNELAHSYDEELAQEVYEFAVKNFAEMLETYNMLWNKFAKNPEIKIIN